MSRMYAPVAAPSLGGCPQAHFAALDQCHLLSSTNAASMLDGPGCCPILQAQMESISILQVQAPTAVALRCVALLS